MGKKVLITGSAGLIGSHLCDELLKKGYKVTGLDNLKVGRLDNIKHSLENKNFKFVKADILDPIAVKKVAKGVDIIVHLAASKKIGEKGSAYNTLRINVDGTRNVFEAARTAKAKVVFASTSDVYGTSKDIPFREDGDLVIGSPTAKRWTYAVSKIIGEQMALAYYKEFDVPAVIIRYFGGFSARSSFTWSGGHVPVFIDAILRNKPVIIHGDGKQTRSMAYVDDQVRGTILAMENRKAIGEVFNIGNDEEMSVIETARLIQKLAGKKTIKIKYIPFRKIFGSYEEIMRRIPDLSKARRVLGYRPRFNLEDGIRMTIEARKGRRAHS